MKTLTSQVLISWCDVKLNLLSCQKKKYLNLKFLNYSWL